MTRVSTGLRETHPEVPWRQVIGMRHVIVHGYDRVRLDIVSSVVAEHVQPLRQQISAVLEEME